MAPVRDGYALVDANSIIASYGYIPQKIVWPDGDVTEPGELSSHGRWKFIERWRDDATIGPGQTFSLENVTIEADKVTVSRTAVALTGDGLAASLAARKARMIEAVIAERAIRLAAGFPHDFGDERGEHHIGTTPQDMIGWDEVSKAASAMIALGAGAQTIQLVTDTGPAIVTALEWQQILVAAAAFRQPIWARSFLLQASIAAVADHATLDAIDINAGWPGA